MLRAAVSAALGGGAVGAATTIGSTPARAAVEEMTIRGTSRELTTTSIEAVPVQAVVEWAYEVPESPTGGTLTLAAGAGDASPSPVAEQAIETPFQSNDGTTDLTADLLSETALDAQTLVPARGETAHREITVQVRLEVVADDRVLARAVGRDTATLRVSRPAYNASRHADMAVDGEVRIVV